VLNVVPVVGEMADVVMAADLLEMTVEFHDLRIETEAALAFASHAPYSLEELRVSEEDGSFDSYRDFTKDDTEKRFGPAGDGFQYHHIVTQGGANLKNISPEQLHNTDNIVRVPTLVHELINAEYNKKKDGTNMTVYQWVQTQPYEVQRAEGIEIMRKLGIIK
jgi:hypothetical protein